MSFKPIKKIGQLAASNNRYVKVIRPDTAYQTNHVVFKFKPGVGELDVKRGVDYYVSQTNEWLAEMGRPKIAKVESLANYADGQILVKGAGVGSIAEWVMLPTTPKPPPPPPPWIPDDIFVDIRLPATKVLQPINRKLR
ncbi:hypothetical protein ACFSUS_02735 [Spirosoma soli]|uniref:Uncharacterized protein n=1 Tax=Spirosoma soli TaxID=1770529 RepID=A0ABW5LXZ1_9BACT